MTTYTESQFVDEVKTRCKARGITGNHGSFDISVEVSRISDATLMFAAVEPGTSRCYISDVKSARIMRGYGSKPDKVRVGTRRACALNTASVIESVMEARRMLDSALAFQKREMEIVPETVKS